MAEGVLFNIAEGILKSLGSLAAEEIKLLWGVEDELGKLESTVLTIQAVLLDAEEKQDVNPAVRAWLQKLNDILYDADDLLDAVSTEALRRELLSRDKKAKKVRTFLSKSNQLAFGLKLAHKIKSTTERLEAVKAERGFLLEERHEERQIKHRARDDTDSVVPAEEVIGRENDKEAIIGHLIDANSEEIVSIHAIVGLGGLGKTTLAQLIFNDEKVQKHFEVKMWVCVGDDFDVKIIVKKMLESATNKEQANVEMNTLANYLQNEINGRKYLLILDDVWNEDHEKWSNLKKLLVAGTRDSKILITTRSDKVAKMMHSNPYYLKGLNEQESWNLFKQMAFEDGNGPRNSRVEEMGREIIRRCVGVPLAVKMMGRLLYFKNPESEWQNFINNELLELPQNETDILPTLKLSYNKLPSYLKPCFTYCSLFPKDYEFEKENLINLWIAQGFVRSSSKNQSLEDSGHDYFLDLFWRSFFQEVKNPGGEIRYKIHDLMHDLAILVTGSLTITIFNNKKRDVSEKARHLALGEDIKFSSTMQISLHRANKIRTFLCPTISYAKVEIDCEALFLSFKFLRTLDLSRRNLKSIPSSISELKHLRHLDVSHNYEIVKLPNSLTTLVNLYTLNLLCCRSLEKLPRDIKNLVHLRHLENDGFELRYMPRGLGQLTNLQKLTKFMVNSSSLSKHSAGVNELSKLNNLRGMLEIWGLSHAKGVALEYKVANLKEKASLVNLHLHWTTRGDINDSDAIDDEMSLEGFQPHPNLKDLAIFNYWGLTISTWVVSLTSLVVLGLVCCKKCQYLPPLSQLPSLEILSLYHMDSIQYISNYGYENECSSNSSMPAAFFPSLKELYLNKCPNLKGWWKSDSSMGVDKDNDNSIETIMVASMIEHHLLPSFPHLSKLSIENCPMLTLMPMFSCLEEELSFKNANWKLVQQIMIMDTTMGTTSSALTPSSSTPLSKLKHLFISSTPELETLPEEWLKNLTSLEYLSIERCDKFQSLFPGLQHAAALQHLKLCNCPNLEFANDKDVMQWQRLKSLLFLEFYGLKKLVSLPIALQHLTTLQHLEISNCESLTTIPEWIYNYKSLQVLRIVGCSCLTSLPEGMCELSSLRMLEIVKCPILMQRCEKEIGEDWPKIAKLPNLKLFLAQEYPFSDEETTDEETSEEVETPKKRRLGFRGLFKDLGLRSFYS